MDNVALFLIIWNFFVFCLYGIDKFCAKTKLRRIPEITLITLSALFSGLGAILAMVLFNHKTSKPKFRYAVPVIFIVQMFILCVSKLKF